MATAISEQTRTQPEFFPLPKPGVSDPHFGFLGFVLLRRRGARLVGADSIRDTGKARGVALIPYRAIEAFVRSRMEAAKRWEI